MGLNREEIIKMLECWTSEYGCKGCPFIEQGCFDCGHIPLEISRSILALIKELTEENKYLESEYDRVYEQAEADIHANMADGGTSCHWCADKTKADTVKMMQERLKNYLKEEYDGFIGTYWIDQVAEEMLEENNV